MSQSSTGTFPFDALPSNFMYDLMTAIELDQSTMSEQQFVDAQSTMNATSLETDLYNHWSSVLTNDSNNVKRQADNGGDNEAENVQVAQSQYSTDNAKAQSNESQMDALVQSTQGQTQSDATNLQMKAQLQQSANTILTTLVNFLGSVIG